MVHTFNPITQEPEAGGSLWIRGQPDLQSELQNRLQNNTEKLCLEKQTKQKKYKVVHNFFLIFKLKI